MITVLTGKNSFTLGLRLKSIVSEATQGIGDIGIERFDASETEIDILLQAAQSLPFLAPKKLVIVDRAQSNTALMERIKEVIDRTPDEVNLVLVGPVFDKRKSSFGMLKKHAILEEFNETDLKALPSWIIEEAKSYGARISKQDAAYLAERVGQDQLLLSSEIEKMSLYSHVITKQVIEELTDQSFQSTIFSLLDAAFAGDSKRAVRIYREQRRSKADPHYIIAMLTWQLQILAMAVYASPQTEATLVSAGQSSFSARKSLALASRIDKVSLRSLVSELSELDLQIKTSADADAALEFFLLSLKK